MLESFIDEHRDDIVSTLQELLQIPSVMGQPTNDSPFGYDVYRALQYVLDFANERGFVTRNVDGFAGHIEYGEGEDYVAVLTHLDVVPAGSGWTYPPFGAEIHDGKVYARGAVDDKGPAMAALWALAGLRHAGIVPKRKIRLIFGLDEESDWRCMEKYFSVEKMPMGGFTPDADFPMIYAEKGVCTLRVEVKADCDSMNPRIVSFEGGHRENMVPDYATVVVDCHSETAALEWEQNLLKESRNRQVEASVRVDGSKLELVVHGISAHASTPDQGTNAVVLLASLLSSHPVSNASMWRAITTQDSDGRGLGIECEDDVSGALTSNLGRAWLSDNTYVFLFNIRYPVNMSPDTLLNRCREYVSDKWSVELTGNMSPLYVPLDSTVVQTLRKVYEDFTGQAGDPIAIGGATYARAIPNAVAFGPLFPGQPELAHQRDECWSLDDYFGCIQIYAQAMLELANTL